MEKEKQIISSLQNGDFTAMKALMEIHQDYVYSLVYQMVKSHADAEEITQDVFVKVYKKIDTYQAKAKFTTWLYTIAYRTSLNYLEKKKIVFNLTEIQTSDNEQDISLDFIGKMEPETIREDSDLTRILWKAIDSIPQMQGVVITLFYLQQFSVNEIAQMMSVSQNTIKINLFRGRKSLKENLQKNYSQEELL